MKTKVNTMRASGVCFMHFRQLDDATGEVLPAGGATVAYKQQEDGSIVCAVSRCRNDELTGKHDNFNRKIGAAIAGGRVLKFINTHGKNKCAHVVTAHSTAEEFRAEITRNMADEYAYVRDFQAKGLPAVVDLPVAAGSLAHVQV